MNSACYKTSEAIPIRGYPIENQNHQPDDTEPLLKVLGLEEKDLIDNIPNLEKLHEHYRCDGACGKRVYGTRYNTMNFDLCESCYKTPEIYEKMKVKHLASKRALEQEELKGHLRCTSCWTDTKNPPNISHICSECPEHNRRYCEKCFDTHMDLLPVEAPPTLSTSYTYKVTFVRRINDNDQEYLYVIEEMGNNVYNVDVHYYLKYFKDGQILIDWELGSYNPYFGCDVNLLEWDSEKNEILIGYSEKHGYCKVTLGLVGCQNSHQEYLKAKPGTFARSQNKEIDQRQARGQVIEFWKNGKKMESKAY